MHFDDPDASFEEVAFRDNESTRKYIDTAISRNIQHTLKFEERFFMIMHKDSLIVFCDSAFHTLVPLFITGKYIAFPSGVAHTKT